MNIKEAERLSGVTKRNIRFYEQKGLLRPARNQENAYREYTSEDVETLKRIRALRMVDMPLEQIREVLEKRASFPATVAIHRNALQSRIKQMETAVKFCEELEAVEQLETWNADDVLHRMEKAENQDHLFARWTRDYRIALEEMLTSLLIGLLLPFAGFLIGVWVASLWGQIDFLAYGFSVLLLLGWGWAGYTLCKEAEGKIHLWMVHAIPIAGYALYSYSRYISDQALPRILEVVVVGGYVPLILALLPFSEQLNQPFLKASVPIVLLLLSFGAGALMARLKIRSILRKRSITP